MAVNEMRLRLGNLIQNECWRSVNEMRLRFGKLNSKLGLCTNNLMIKTNSQPKSLAVAGVPPLMNALLGGANNTLSARGWSGAHHAQTFADVCVLKLLKNDRLEFVSSRWLRTSCHGQASQEHLEVLEIGSPLWCFGLAACSTALLVLLDAALFACCKDHTVSTVGSSHGTYQKNIGIGRSAYASDICCDTANHYMACKQDIQLSPWSASRITRTSSPLAPQRLTPSGRCQSACNAPNHSPLNSSSLVQHANA